MSTITDTVRNVCADLHTDGKSRDDIIVALVTGHGLTLNKATKAYAVWAKEEGIAPTLTSYKEEALEFIADNYKDWDAKAVKDAIVDLVAKFEIAESTARDYTKAYSEQLGVQHPTVNPREAIFNWFKAQDGVADKDEFMAFATGELERSQSNANEYWKGYELHLFLTK